MKKRKKSLTLIEVILSFAFIAAIFSFLMSTFFSSIKLTTKMAVIKEQILSRFHIHQRLSLLFSKVEPAIDHFLERTESAFYTELGPSKNTILYFAFKQESDPELLFSGFLLGKLYLEEDSLYLDIVPLKEKLSSHLRKELLFTGVKSINYIFHKKTSIISGDSTPLKQERRLTEWKIDYPDIPYSMTIHLLLNDETTLEYSFHLCSKIQPIYYE